MLNVSVNIVLGLLAYDALLFLGDSMSSGSGNSVYRNSFCTLLYLVINSVLSIISAAVNSELISSFFSCSGVSPSSCKLQEVCEH